MEVVSMNKTLLGYVPNESPIYALHPFVKLFFLLIVSLFPMFVTAPDWNLGLMLLIIILMWVSRVNMKTLKPNKTFLLIYFQIPKKNYVICLML